MLKRIPEWRLCRDLASFCFLRNWNGEMGEWSWCHSSEDDEIRLSLFRFGCPTFWVYRPRPGVPSQKDARRRTADSAAGPVPEPRTSAGSFLRVGPATVRAAERAMERGKHFKIRPPDKDDGVPHGVSRGMWGAAPTVAVYRVQRAMRFTGSRGPNSLRATPCRSPRTSARSFWRIGPARAVVSG